MFWTVSVGGTFKGFTAAVGDYIVAYDDGGTVVTGLAHGTVNLNKAMIVSSNTFFFSLAYKSDINKLIEHLSNFGFGTKVCADCFNPDP